MSGVWEIDLVANSDAIDVTFNDVTVDVVQVDQVIDVVPETVLLEVTPGPCVDVILQPASVVEISGPEFTAQVDVSFTPIDVVSQPVTIDVEQVGPRGPQGPPGVGAVIEDKDFFYTDGNLTSVVSATTTKTMTYDLDGNLATVSDTASATTKTFTYVGGFLTQVTVS